MRLRRVESVAQTVCLLCRRLATCESLDYSNRTIADCQSAIQQTISLRYESIPVINTTKRLFYRLRSTGHFSRKAFTRFEVVVVVAVVAIIRMLLLASHCRNQEKVFANQVQSADRAKQCKLRFAGCQPATQQTNCLRYVDWRPA
jgi:hypothetical protein